MEFEPLWQSWADIDAAQRRAAAEDGYESPRWLAVRRAAELWLATWL
jgi:hypothetical protein